MKCNVGKTDRVLRFITGTIIILAGFYFKSWLGIIGVVPMLTATFRICPAYIPLGISTINKKT